MNQYISELAAFSFPFIELMVIFSSVKQSSSQSSGPSVSRLVIRCINQKRIVRSWSVSQSVSEPVCQTASQPVCQTASQPVWQSASLAVSCTASQPVCQSVVLPFSQTGSQPVCRIAIQPVWQSARPLVSQSISVLVCQFKYLSIDGLTNSSFPYIS